MTTENGIKIKNIYHMLSYAFSILKHNGYEKLANENFENVMELLSAILLKGIALQLKRGLDREYIEISEATSSLRGKINLTQSIKEQTVLKKKLICSYDEFSVNTKLNQILKSTVYALLSQKINNKTKRELKKLMLFFEDVDIINTKTINWNIKFNRNNANYQMLISICYLIIKNLLQSEDKGNMKMQKFLDEQQMCKLYEKFILEYYKQHLPKNYEVVGSKNIEWAEDNHFLELLPNMVTDVYIKNRTTNEVLIIDAKFYKNISQSYYDTDKYRSNNLYQIFTYVKNEQSNPENKANVSGMLLYAQTDHEKPPNNEYIMRGNKIYIRSLNMNAEFDEIKNQLNEILHI